jgi:uncharacterized membrane protein (DUF2068 family)
VDILTGASISPRSTTIARVPRERALTLIIAYKLIKGGLWFVFAAVIAVSTQLGLESHLLGFADQLRHHSQAWSLELAQLIVRVATRRGLWTVTLALVADGAVTLVEGWALLRGRWWGPWLVVVATGSLLPFEFVALARRPHVSRAALVVVNAAIVAYLARKALRERRERDRATSRSGTMDL